MAMLSTLSLAVLVRRLLIIHKFSVFLDFAVFSASFSFVVALFKNHSISEHKHTHTNIFNNSREQKKKTKWRSNHSPKSSFSFFLALQRKSGTHSGAVYHVHPLWICVTVSVCYCKEKKTEHSKHPKKRKNWQKNSFLMN